MRDFVRARNSTEAFWALDPFAVVKPDDPRFADIEKDLPREHFGVTAPLRRLFDERAVGDVKLAILGHQGTGKTTLVRKAMQGLAPTGLMAIYVDALTAFDQGDFGLPDVMLVITRAVIDALAEQGVELEPTLTEATYHWFADELVTHDIRRQIEKSIGASVESGIGFAVLAKFAAKLTAALKMSNEYRTEIRSQARRDIDDLIRRVNAVLDGAHAALSARKQQLCIVLDNLEKIPDRALVERAVVVTNQELRELRCHLVFFLHPADDYAPQLMAASQAYRAVHIPSIPVRFKGDSPDMVRPEALAAIRRLLDARLDIPGVFAEPDRAVELLARKSGGHLRDILQLALRAVELSEPDKVDLTHIESAARYVAGHRTPLMKPSDWTRAVAIHDSHAVENTPEDGRLLLHSCVLFYDGEPWWDVHPVVRDHPRFEQTRSERALARRVAEPPASE